MRISYLEIYNEAGYDLLDPSHESKGLEDLPKVSLLEDDDGRMHLRNLSAQVARLIPSSLVPPTPPTRAELRPRPIRTRRSRGLRRRR